VRLAYAVAIQAPFDILLVDEMLAVGDASFQQKCLATFEEFRAAGKTVVFVSHSPEALRRYCDRALLLENGSIFSIGPTRDIVDRYLDLQGVASHNVVEQAAWPDRTP
jgi:ABC-type polysaccharide/polyol phosphate transport system ATPase subunit